MDNPLREQIEQVLPTTNTQVSCIIDDNWNEKLVSVKVCMELEFAWQTLASNQLREIKVIFTVSKHQLVNVNGICHEIELSGLNPIVVEALGHRSDSGPSQSSLKIEVSISNEKYRVLTFRGKPLFISRRTRFAKCIYNVCAYLTI